MSDDVLRQIDEALSEFDKGRPIDAYRALGAARREIVRLSAEHQNGGE